MMHKVPRRYWFVIGGLLGLAFVIVYGVAVRAWAGPWEPLVGFALFGLTPMLFWGFLGAFALDPTRTEDAIVDDESPPLRARMRLTFTPMLAFGALYLLLTLTWAWPAMRAMLVNVLATQHMAPTIAQALEDPVASVRLSACEALKVEGSDTAALALSQRLQDPSEEVVDCAVRTMNGRDRDVVMVRFAAEKWSRELAGAETMDGDRACQLSNRLRESERLGNDVASMRLMQCALKAPSRAARDCCTQSFRSILGPANATPSMILAAPAELVGRGITSTVPELLEATFSEEPTVLHTRQQLRLDDDREKAWALNVACEALSQGGARWRTELSARIADVVSSDTCRLEPATETTVRLWSATCSTVFAADPGSLSMPVTDALCVGIDNALLVDALSEAESHTREALRNAREPDARVRMLRELLDYHSTVPEPSGDLAVYAGASRRGKARSSFFSTILTMANDQESGATVLMGDDEEVDEGPNAGVQEMMRRMMERDKVAREITSDDTRSRLPTMPSFMQPRVPEPDVTP